jgi:predicted polyphosphate/ATP-dependent NAD kinase
MSHESISLTALGAHPENLSSSVSLATPLTMNRVVGRDRANAVLRELAEAFSVKEPTLVLEDKQRDVVTFAGSVDGDPAELLMILTAGGDGTNRAVDACRRCRLPLTSNDRDRIRA